MEGRKGMKTKLKKRRSEHGVEVEKADGGFRLFCMALPLTIAVQGWANI